jgi:hypothetical protein
MGVQLRTGGIAIVVAAAAATAVLGPMLSNDAAAPPASTIADAITGNPAAPVVPEQPTTEPPIADDGASPTSLLPGATMHNDLGWTMQIGADWQSQEGAGPVQWRVPDGTVAVISEDSAADIDSYADAFDFGGVITDLSDTSVSPQPLDDGTDARLLRASGSVDGEPVLVFGLGIARADGFVTALFYAPAADYGTALNVVEPYLRTVRTS